jgi:hypothetical protein
MLELEQKVSAGKEEGEFEGEEGSFRWATAIEEKEVVPFYEGLVTVHWEVRGREQGLSVTTYLPKSDETE